MSFVKTKSGKWDWGAIFLILIYLIAFLWAGMGEWVRGDIDFSQIGNTEWWAGVLERLGLNHMILLSTIFYKINKEMEENPDVRAEEIVIKNAVNEARFKPTTFNPWLRKYNKQRKITKYRNKLKAKIDELERNASPLDINAYEEHLKDSGKHRDNKFVINHIKLDREYSNEYIEKYIPQIKVPNFKEIQSSFITNGYSSRGAHDDSVDEYLPESGSKKMAYDLGPKVMFTIAAVVALESIVLEAANAQTIVQGIIGVFFVITPMILQIFIGLSYAVRYVKEKVLVDFRKRKELISIYFNDVGVVEEYQTPIPLEEGGKSDGGT